MRTKLQIQIPRRGVYESAIYIEQAGRGGRSPQCYCDSARNSCNIDSSDEYDSRDQRPYHHHISPYRTKTNILVLSGPPNPPKVEIYLEKLAVDTLVKLSKGNVDALLSAK